MNAPKLAQILGGDYSRVFFLLLGLLSQIFGGGISGNMMHEYEGWQVCRSVERYVAPQYCTATTRKLHTELWPVNCHVACNTCVA